MNLTELSVLVPEERVAEFYTMLGNWLSGRSGEAADDAADSAGGRRQRRRQTSRAPLSSRYSGIREYLKEQEGPTAEATFDELEAAIGDTLPASAARHRAWWANTERNTQARIWMDEGWRVDRVDFDERKVLFSRV